MMRVELFSVINRMATVHGVVFADFAARLSADGTRHAQRSAKPHPPASRRLAAHGIIREARQETRDRNRALQSGQRHAGAVMCAGSEGEKPVRGASDVE